mmetsp:Transcript_42150/g.68270  ORF Transcript_42150/g.68270 Transcript_42150/m.68270 type:complete len:288 (+) Transcript_42150:46-909(+)
MSSQPWTSSDAPPSRSSSKARLPPLAAQASPAPLPEEMMRRSTPSLLLSSSGVVARKRASAHAERLDPLKGSGSKGPPLIPLGSSISASRSCGSLFKAPIPASSSQPSAKLQLRSKSSMLVHELGSGSEPADRAAALARLPALPAKPSLQASTPAHASAVGGQSSGSRAPAISRASALVAELGGASVAAAEVDKVDSEAAKNAAKCKAVASLQRLFFEEVQRGGDANAAAAAALKRLAEETRQDDESRPVSRLEPSLGPGEKHLQNSSLARGLRDEDTDDLDLMPVR